MRKCRRDQNMAEIVAALRGLGWLVIDTSAVGPNGTPGFPDILCVRAGRVVFAEVKSGKGDLTWDEATFSLGLICSGADYVVLRTVDDVVRMTEGEG